MPPGDVAPVVAMSLLTISVAVVLVLRGPVGKAWARRIEGTAGQPDASAPAVMELQARVSELEEQVGRLHELEERLDFAERLLAQARVETGRLEAGRSERAH